LSALVQITGEITRLLEPVTSHGAELRSASVRVASGSGSLIWLVQTKGTATRLIHGLRVGDIVRAHGEMLASLGVDPSGATRLNLRLHAVDIRPLTLTPQIGTRP
jgi:hypothetical protein